ncbi:unnamed protein product [Pleuronectes platessa]|uniref:Uncharacterized protein n=1 Tax=Pleuronectes platessa TaxID=8262 RepID=A0A9N7YCC3_PLEPL|nr:unnamed protein product [Pleuronectes platessa]
MGYDQYHFPVPGASTGGFKPVLDDSSCHFSVSHPVPLAGTQLHCLPSSSSTAKKPSLTLQGLEFGLIYQHQSLFVRMSYGLSLLRDFQEVVLYTANTLALPTALLTPIPPPFITVNLPIPPDPLAAQRGHFGMQMGKTGIELPAWLEDNRSTPQPHSCRAGSV